MKDLALSLCVLSLACTASGTAWSACSTVVAETELLTTVTVIAGTDDSCEWEVSNGYNLRTVSVTGLAVPNLLASYSASYVARSIYNTPGQSTVNAAEAICNSVNGPTCTQTASYVYNIGSTLHFLTCKSSNTGALSSTATCLFERVPWP